MLLKIMLRLLRGRYMCCLNPNWHVWACLTVASQFLEGISNFWPRDHATNLFNTLCMTWLFAKTKSWPWNSTEKFVRSMSWRQTRKELARDKNDETVHVTIPKRRWTMAGDGLTCRSFPGCIVSNRRNCSTVLMFNKIRCLWNFPFFLILSKRHTSSSNSGGCFFSYAAST